MTTAIRNAICVTPQGLQSGRDVILHQGRIQAMPPATGEPNRAADETVDAAGGYLAPGFIDLHIHGTHEFLVDNGPADLRELCRLLPAYGVTGFLPTVCPRPKGEDAAVVRALSEVTATGARILGFHLEGPFLTVTGALPPEAIGQADPERVRNLIAATGQYPAIFSIAPDFADVLPLI